jgi:diguanylate cyclase (GGDEF)-like protein
MLNRVSRFLDRSGNEHKDQRMLYLVFLLGALTIVLITWPREPLGDIGFFGLIGITLLLLFLTYRGQLRPVRLILPLAGFLAITRLVYTGGIYDEAVDGYYFILIIAGLMIGQRALLLFGVMSALALLLIGWAEINEWMITYFDFTPSPKAVVTTAFFLLATTFGLNYMVVRLSRALRNAQENEAAQVKANQQLRALEAVLEKRIDERTAELNQSNHKLMEQLEYINSLQDKLRQEAVRDPLTGLFNRRHLNEMLPIEFARAKRSNAPLTIFLLDIDHFKNVNDTHGHQVGDQVLQMVSEALKKNVRLGDIVCRYGGEEFLLVMPGMKIEDARIRAEILRTIVGSQIVKGRDGAFGVTISIGAALYPQDSQTEEDLISMADEALYRAKQNGRNRVEFN